jgi:hypothetical protein
LGKSAKHRLAVFFVGSNEEVKILRCSWFCMRSESIATRDKVLNALIAEGA